MYLTPSPENTKAMGRIRWQDGIPYLGNAGSYLEFVLTASYLTAELDTRKGSAGGEYDTWLSLRIDGEERAFSLREGTAEYPLFQWEAPRTVTVRLLKRSESGYGNTGVIGFSTDAAFLTPTADRPRRIQFVGDSITCGFGCEQKDGELFDTAGENCCAAYAIRTAQMLEADWHLVAQSGIGIYSSCVEEGATQPNTRCLMPSLYRYTDLSCDEIRGWKPEIWDNTRWQPQLVVINLGTNDALYAGNHPDRVQQFGEAYAAFLRQAAAANPGAQLLGVMGVMDGRLCEEAKRRADALSAAGLPVHFYRQTPQKAEDGIGAAGHPSVLTHEKSAKALAEVIRQLMRWDTPQSP